MKQVKQAVNDFLNGNSTRIWRKLVLFVFSIFLVGFTTVAAVGGWLLNEVYTFPKEYVTQAEFDRYCEARSKVVSEALQDFSADLREAQKKYDELLKFLLNKHYKGVDTDAYTRNNPSGNRD